MLVELLKTEFQQRKKVRPQYSMRAFAKSLKIHSSTLCVLLSRKRKLSPKQAEKILREIHIDAFRKKQILLSLINPIPSQQSDSLVEMKMTDITLSIPANKMIQAKELIAEFHQKLSALSVIAEEADEAYHLSLHLYPISNSLG